MIDQQHLSQRVVFGCIVLVAILAMVPGFVQGHVFGHSSALNVSWAEGFAAELAKGNIYPRWLPEMSNGAGSAVFYFYGPATFYIASPFVILSGSAKLGLIAASIVMLAASGLAAYGLCRRYAGQRAALVAATIYMLLPYHFGVDIWLRSAFAEQGSFVFMPLAALCVLRLKEDWRFGLGVAVSYAGLIFCHLPTALLFSPALGILILAESFNEKSWRVFLLSAVAVLTGLSMSAIYLLPALALQGMVQAQFWQPDAVSDHLFFSAQNFEDFSFFVAPLGVASALLVGCCCGGWFATGRRKVLLPWLVITIIAMFMMSGLSKSIWEISGPFARVQFPWRLLAVTDLALTVLIAGLLGSKVSRNALLIVPAVVAILLSVAASIVAQHILQAPNSHNLLVETQDIGLKADASEYLPSCYQLPENFIEPMTVKLSLARQAAATGVFYYPFLGAKQNGKSVPLECDGSTGLAKPVVGAEQGVLEYRVKPLPVEIVGRWISFAGLMLFAVTGVLALRRAGRNYF